jgi:hypothetical protein
MMQQVIPELLKLRPPVLWRQVPNQPGAYFLAIIAQQEAAYYHNPGIKNPRIPFSYLHSRARLKRMKILIEYIKVVLIHSSGDTMVRSTKLHVLIMDLDDVDKEL